jgi:hypothetical protein
MPLATRDAAGRDLCQPHLARDQEPEVRQRISDALGAGTCTGPDGRLSTWRLAASGAGELREDERLAAEDMEAHNEARRIN